MLLKHKKIIEENVQLREQISDIAKATDIVGESQQIHNVINLAKTVAKTDTTVMLRGESGTGKELIARAIHANSDRQVLSNYRCELRCSNGKPAGKRAFRT